MKITQEEKYLLEIKELKQEIQLLKEQLNKPFIRKESYLLDGSIFSKTDLNKTGLKIQLLNEII